MRPPNDTADTAPTVSIVTPAFNAGSYLAETIDSVRRQTFADFEMLVVDDGSTDDTFAIAQRYAARDSRLRLSRQPNLGIAGARNAALARARGRFIALLDSDDLWMPTYLANQLRILERRPDIAILSANAINLGGARDGQPLLRAGSADNLRELTLLQLVRAEDSMSILSLFRREVADTLQGFDVTLRRSEDYDFWLRAIAAGFRVAINPQPLGFYRRRADSLSADELGMLRAIQQPLAKLRLVCGGQPDILQAVDRQLADLAQRELIAGARLALVSGNMPQVAAQFEALVALTGAPRYRIARWLTIGAPATVRWAYRLKQLRNRVRRRRGTASPSAPSLEPVSRANA